MPETKEIAVFYLEDLKVGQRFKSGTHALDAEQIKAFAAEFDPQPCHMDEKLAEDSILEGLAASGWHTAAITMRLNVEGGLPLAGGIIPLRVAGVDAQLADVTRQVFRLVIEDFAACRLVSADDAAPRRRLAAAAFAHQAERFPALDGEANAIHRAHVADDGLEHAAPDGKVHL